MYTLSLVYTLSVPCAGLHMIAPLKKRKGIPEIFYYRLYFFQTSYNKKTHVRYSYTKGFNLRASG